MAHEIDMSNGKASIAYTMEKPWHGLGTELKPGSTVDEWIIAAGLDWNVMDSNVFMDDGFGLVAIPNKKALFRSDTKQPLSIVSNEFNVVQPKEVVEFFRDLVELHDMRLSTAGSLFDGKRFWALAELGKDFEVFSGDKVKGNLLLTTAVDGSLNTTAKFISTRVVCNNTLNIALGEKAKNLVKVSHRCQWDPDATKIDLGLIDEAWGKFISNIKKMASTKVTDEKAREFYVNLYNDRDLTAKTLTKKVDRLMELYTSGTGSEMSNGTYWGIINGVTEAYTFGTGRKTESSQFWDGFYGSGAEIKDKAYESALMLV